MQISLKALRYVFFIKLTILIEVFITNKDDIYLVRFDSLGNWAIVNTQTQSSRALVRIIDIKGPFLDVQKQTWFIHYKGQKLPLDQDEGNQLSIALEKSKNKFKNVARYIKYNNDDYVFCVEMGKGNSS